MNDLTFLRHLRSIILMSGIGRVTLIEAIGQLVELERKGYTE